MRAKIILLALVALIMLSVSSAAVVEAKGKPYWNLDPRPDNIVIVISPIPIGSWTPGEVANQEVELGAQVTYCVSVFGYRGGKISLSASVPPGWRAVLSKDSVTSRSWMAQTVRLSVFAPEDAVPSAVATIEVTGTKKPDVSYTAIATATVIDSSLTSNNMVTQDSSTATSDTTVSGSSTSSNTQVTTETSTTSDATTTTSDATVSDSTTSSTTTQDTTSATSDTTTAQASTTESTTTDISSTSGTTSTAAPGNSDFGQSHNSGGGG